MKYLLDDPMFNYPIEKSNTEKEAGRGDYEL